nr:MAG TPA: hypothetical protein [Bacteriophage sp.]
MFSDFVVGYPTTNFYINLKEKVKSKIPKILLDSKFTFFFGFLKFKS